MIFLPGQPIFDFGGIQVQRLSWSEIYRFLLKRFRRLERTPRDLWTDGDMAFVEYIEERVRELDEQLDRDGFVDLGDGRVAYKELH